MYSEKEIPENQTQKSTHKEVPLYTDNINNGLIKQYLTMKQRKMLSHPIMTKEFQIKIRCKSQTNKF